VKERKQERIMVSKVFMSRAIESGFRRKGGEGKKGKSGQGEGRKKKTMEGEVNFFII
jgi:hypothetical protein